LFIRPLEMPYSPLLQQRRGTPRFYAELFA
jgi:hypothetical protein